MDLLTHTTCLKKIKISSLHRILSISLSSKYQLYNCYGTSKISCQDTIMNNHQQASFSSTSSSSSSSQQNTVFDRSLKTRHRQFYYNHTHGDNDIDYYDYLRKEITERLADRLDDILKPFPLALEIGSHRGYFLNVLEASIKDRGKDMPLGGIQSLIQTNSVPVSRNNIPAIHHSHDKNDKENHHHNKNNNNTSNNNNNDYESNLTVNHVVCDEENLPFPPESFDMIICPFSIHWINDVPHFLQQIKNILRPDGVFLGAILGGSTLTELRDCFYLSDVERKGGFGPHTSPFILPSDVAGLMQAAGFSLPTVDVDTIQISYPDAFSLMEHIQHMGEGNASLNRQLFVGKDTMLAMAALYQDMYGLEDGSVTATFQVIYVIGWHPDESQQKPCQRGTASRSLKEIATVAGSEQMGVVVMKNKQKQQQQPEEEEEGEDKKI